MSVDLWEISTKCLATLNWTQSVISKNPSVVGSILGEAENPCYLSNNCMLRDHSFSTYKVSTEAGKAEKARKRPVLQILAGKAGKHIPFTTTKNGKAGKCIFQSRKKSFSSVFDY